MANDVRSKVIAALEAGAAPAARMPCVADYLAGGDDVPLSALEIDSLALMEMCIWWELHCDVSLSPEQVRSAESLDGIGRLLEPHA